MDWISLLIIVFYIAGVFVAFIQLSKWATDEALDSEIGGIIPALSLVSWFIYPIYGIIKLTDKE